MPGRIDKRRGDAERSFLHRLRHQRFHFFELFGNWGAIRISQHCLADLRGADVGSYVDRRTSFFQTIEIFRQRRPVDRQVILVQLRLQLG